VLREAALTLLAHEIDEEAVTFYSPSCGELDEPSFLEYIHTDNFLYDLLDSIREDDLLDTMGDSYYSRYDAHTDEVDKQNKMQDLLAEALRGSCGRVSCHFSQLSPLDPLNCS